jgi:hypothetical protein
MIIILFIRILIIAMFTLLGLIFYDIFRKPKTIITEEPTLPPIQVTETPEPTYVPFDNLNQSIIIPDLTKDVPGTFPGQKEWTGIATSQDGKYITAVSFNGKIIMTENSFKDDIDEVEWKEYLDDKAWVGVVMNGSGNTQVAITKNESLYYYEKEDDEETSTWIELKNSIKNWTGVTIDNNGELVIACENNSVSSTTGQKGYIWKIDLTMQDPTLSQVDLPNIIGSAQNWLKVKTNTNHNYTVAITPNRVFFTTSVELLTNSWVEIKLPDGILPEKVNFVDCAISNKESNPIVYIADNISNGSTGNIFVFDYNRDRNNNKLRKVTEIPPYRFTCIDTNVEGDLIACGVDFADLLVYSFKLRKFNNFIKTDNPNPNPEENSKIISNINKFKQANKRIFSCCINKNPIYTNIDGKYQVYSDFGGSIYFSKNTGYTFTEFER